MFEKYLYSQEMYAREIDDLVFVEGKYLLDPNDPKAFNSLDEIEEYKSTVAREAMAQFLDDEEDEGE